MDVLYTHCCGIDVGKKEVVACLVVPGEDGWAKKTIRRFWTMTEDLEGLAAWLRGAGCVQVAMESTGVSGNRSGTSWKRRACSSCCW